MDSAQGRLCLGTSGEGGHRLARVRAFSRIAIRTAISSTTRASAARRSQDTGSGDGGGEDVGTIVVIRPSPADGDFLRQTRGGVEPAERAPRRVESNARKRRLRKRLDADHRAERVRGDHQWARAAGLREHVVHRVHHRALRSPAEVRVGEVSETDAAIQ